MHPTCNPVFPGRQVQLKATSKPVTPFGGLVSPITFFEGIGLAEQISALMPFAYTSPNAIPPAQTLVAFIVSVVAGARRLAHTDWLRADKALHALLGIARFPDTDTVRNLFARFRQCHIEEFWRPLWKWLLELAWPLPAAGFSLDLDSTVFQRSGRQEGSSTKPRRFLSGMTLWAKPRSPLQWENTLSRQLNQVIRVLVADQPIDPAVSEKPPSRLQKYQASRSAN